MKSLRSIAVAVPILSCVLLGCPHVGALVTAAAYPKDVHETKWEKPDLACEGKACWSVGECHVLRPAIVWETMNGPALATHPKPVEHLVATCDPAHCSAVVDGETLVVKGVGSGSTKVMVSYDHPVTKEHVEDELEVAFADAPVVDALHPRIERDERACPR